MSTSTVSCVLTLEIKQILIVRLLGGLLFLTIFSYFLNTSLLTINPVLYIVWGRKNLICCKYTAK